MSKRLLTLAVAAALVLTGAVALARSVPSLTASGPVSVSGAEANGAFAVGTRTVRQVRYEDHGTLGYTFTLANDSWRPVRVVGLAEDQPQSRLFTVRDLTPTALAAGEKAAVTLTLGMGGCESLSARAGSFVSRVAVVVESAGARHEVDVALPEEIHTGSPREAFCPNSTATSRPRG